MNTQNQAVNRQYRRQSPQTIDGQYLLCEDLVFLARSYVLQKTAPVLPALRRLLHPKMYVCFTCKNIVSSSGQSFNQKLCSAVIFVPKIT